MRKNIEEYGRNNHLQNFNSQQFEGITLWLWKMMKIGTCHSEILFSKSMHCMIMMVMVMIMKYFNHNINNILQSSPRVTVEEEEDGNTLVVRGVTQLDEVGICSAYLSFVIFLIQQTLTFLIAHYLHHGWCFSVFFVWKDSLIVTLPNCLFWFFLVRKKSKEKVIHLTHIYTSRVLFSLFFIFWNPHKQRNYSGVLHMFSVGIQENWDKAFTDSTR